MKNTETSHCVFSNKLGKINQNEIILLEKKRIPLNKIVFIELLTQRVLKYNIITGVSGTITIIFALTCKMIFIAVIGLIFINMGLFMKKEIIYLQIIYEDPKRETLRINKKLKYEAYQLINAFYRIK